MPTNKRAATALALAVSLLAAGAGSAQRASAADLADALSAFENRDYEQAFDQVAPLADIGMAEGLHLLSRIHLKPEFAGYDPQESFRLMRLAAEQGLAVAQHDIGEMYRLGVGVKADALAAFGWHLRAARQRLRSSEFKLSEMYAGGNGVQRDEAQAAKWAARAKKNDEEAAPTAAAVATPATPAPRKRRTPTRSSGPVRYRVQLGAYQRLAVAQKAKARIAAALPGMQDHGLTVASVDKGDGNGMLHRIQAGPLPDFATAQDLCNRVALQLPRQGCYAIKLRGRPP